MLICLATKGDVNLTKHYPDYISWLYSHPKGYDATIRMYALVLSRNLVQNPTITFSEFIKELREVDYLSATLVWNKLQSLIFKNKKRKWGRSARLQVLGHTRKSIYRVF